MVCSSCDTPLKLQTHQRSWVVTPVDDADLEVDDVDPEDLTEIPGVDARLAKVLRQGGYATLWDVAFETPENLATNTDISRSHAIRIVDAASQLLHLDADEDYQEYLEHKYNDTEEEDDVDW
jgi:predicted flap endonuclease-1-like 5' DNA nuclease